MIFTVKHFFSGVLLGASTLILAACSTDSTTEGSVEVSEVKHGAANHLVSLNVHIDSLKRDRKILVYLPADYYVSDRRYPVLYMHDGQNLFDEQTSYAGEWRVDETMNSLATNKQLSAIVVGIYNGEVARMTEYSPWPNERFGEGEGKAYVEFIANTLKPTIDRQFRTLPSREHTGIMGSSMGGLISHYAVFAYPEVFGRAGVLSPSYWYNDNVYQFTQRHSLPADTRIFMAVGEKEGEDMVANMQRMATHLVKRELSGVRLHSQVDEGREHNEAYWADIFDEAVLWLYK